MTGGLGDVSSGGIPDFDAGPLGSISTILNKFDLSFNGLLDEFLEIYNEFKDDTLSNLDIDIQVLVDLKPNSLPHFPDLLQLGSKKPATQFSPEFKAKLWEKLTLKFPGAYHNGVRIPGLSLGMSLNDEFPDGVGFPGEFRRITNACKLA